MISLLDWTQVTHFWLKLNKLLLIILWCFIDRTVLILQDWEFRIHCDFAVIFKSVRHKYRVGRNNKVGIANRHTE